MTGTLSPPWWKQWWNWQVFFAWGRGTFIPGNALERVGKDKGLKKKKQKEKNYFRLQATADAAALAKHISPTRIEDLDTYCFRPLICYFLNSHSSFSIWIKQSFVLQGLIWSLLFTFHFCYFPLPIPLLIECPVKLQSYIFNSATHLQCKNRV